MEAGKTYELRRNGVTHGLVKVEAGWGGTRTLTPLNHDEVQSFWASGKEIQGVIEWLD